MLGIRVGAIQQPVAAKVLVDATHRSLQHLTDLARCETPEIFPRELPTLRVIRPVEEHHMQVWIEPQVRRRSLHHRDRAGLRAAHAASAARSA
jgi:hypothetical protein